MKLIKFPNIGWIVLPKRNIITETVLQYITINDDNEFRSLYEDFIVNQNDDNPDIEKANSLLGTNSRIFINYTGIQALYPVNIIEDYDLNVLISGNEFIEMMVYSIELLENIHDNLDKEDMKSWNLDKWIEFTGAEKIEY